MQSLGSVLTDPQTAAERIRRHKRSYMYALKLFLICDLHVAEWSRRHDNGLRDEHLAPALLTVVSFFILIPRIPRLIDKKK